MEKLSKTLLGRKDEEEGLPLDSIEETDPETLLGYFQSQFAPFPDPMICSLYRILETDGNKVCFLWTHPHQDDPHDRLVLDVDSFLKRNFPQLEFYMICLYANHTWAATPEKTPPSLLVFSLETPYSLHRDMGFFHQMASQVVSMLLKI